MGHTTVSLCVAICYCCRKLLFKSYVVATLDSDLSPPQAIVGYCFSLKFFCIVCWFNDWAQSLESFLCYGDQCLRSFLFQKILVLILSVSF